MTTRGPATGRDPGALARRRPRAPPADDGDGAGPTPSAKRLRAAEAEAEAEPAGSGGGLARGESSRSVLTGPCGPRPEPAAAAAASPAGGGGGGAGRPLHVLLTGGSDGIGAAAVRRFARAGHRVSFTYRSGRDRAAALVEDLVAALAREAPDAAAVRGRLNPLFFDQGDAGAVEALVAAAEAALGDVDVLVLNAALGSATVAAYAPAGKRRQDEALLRVNALGPLWLAEALAPRMEARGGGRIVFVSSVGGGTAAFHQYSKADLMSNAAVSYLAKHLAAELVHSPVDVFCVAPGATQTPMFEQSTLAPLAPGERARFLGAFPKRRLIQPGEVADLMYWLGTDPAAQVLHGATLDASMGLGVRPGLQTENPLQPGGREH